MVGNVPAAGPRRYPGYFLGVLSLMLFMNYAQSQILYYGSSLLLRRVSPVSLVGNQYEYALEFVDEFGYGIPIINCQTAQVSYVPGGVTSPTCSTLGPAATGGFTDLGFGSVANILFPSAVDTVGRTINGATSVSFDAFAGAAGTSQSTHGFSPPTDLRRNVLNQPPIANMLPLVQVRYGCVTTIAIPMYDSDRFDTVRCEQAQQSNPGECGGGCPLGSGINLQSDVAQRLCVISVPPISQRPNNFEPVSLVIIDTSLSGEDMSRVSLQFTLEFLQRTGSCGTGPPGYPATSIFPNTGAIIRLVIESTFNNRVEFQADSQPIPVLTARGGRAGFNTPGFLNGNPFLRLNVPYDEVTNTLPEVTCFQYIDDVTDYPSEVRCAFFEQNRAHFIRSAIAGTAGTTLRTQLRVNQPTSFLLDIESNALTANGNVVVTSPTGTFQAQPFPPGPNVVDVDLFLDSANVNQLEVCMISLRQVAGPEVLVYKHPEGSNDFILNVAYVTVTGTTTARIEVCRSRPFDIAAVVYVTGSSAISAGLQSLRNMDDQYFVIPPNQDCTSVDVTFVMTPVSLAFDAEGPHRVDPANRIVVLSSPTGCSQNSCAANQACNDIVNGPFCVANRCEPNPFNPTQSNPCSNNGLCREALEPMCDCTETGFSGDFCTIQVCIVNPCLNGGLCSIDNGVSVCDCTATFFFGQFCADPVQIGYQNTVVTVNEGHGTEVVQVCLPAGVTRTFPVNFVVQPPSQGNPTDFNINLANTAIPTGSRCTSVTLNVFNNFPQIGVEPVETFQITLVSFTNGIGVNLNANTLFLTIQPVANACAPNPCQNFGTCTVVQGTAICDCTDTFFIGPMCQFPFQLQFNEAQFVVTVRETTPATTIFLDVCYDPIVNDRGFATTFTLQRTLGLGVIQGDLINPAFNADFTAPLSGTIQAGQSCATIPIAILDDSIPEDTETFSLSLQQNVQGIPIDPNSDLFTVNILDNDIAVPVLSLQTLALRAVEGTDSQIAIAVCLDQNAQSPVSFSLQTIEGTPEDSLNNYQVGAPGVILTGSMCTTFDILFTNDNFYEATTFFDIQLSSIVQGSATINPNADRLQVELQDDDELSVGFDRTQYTTVVTAQSVAVQVCLFPRNPQRIHDASISFFIQNPFRTGVIQAGMACTILDIPIAIAGQTEDFTIQLLTTDVGIINPAMETTDVIIQDVPAMVGFLGPPFSFTGVPESAGSVIPMVCLDPTVALDTAVTVGITVISGNNGDFIVPTQVVIAPPQVCAPFNVVIIDDNNFEAEGDLLQLRITSVSNPIIIDPGAAQFTIMVIDNDQPFVNFASPTNTVSESDGVATVNVCLSGTVLSNVIIRLEQDPQFTGDFTVPNQITIPAGVLCQQLTITIIQDQIVEPTETLTVTLAQVLSAGNALIGQANVHTLSVTDDESATLSLLFDQTTVTEGQSFSFRVCLDSALNVQGSVVVALLATFVTASSTDIGSIPTPVTITNPTVNRCSAPLQFMALQDSIINEGDETFNVLISAVIPNNFNIGPPVTLTIQDVDVTVVDFSPDTYVVTEGGSIQLRVCSNTVIQNANIVGLTYNFVPPTFASDLLAPLPTLITIPAGQTCGSVNIGFTNDNDPTDETFSVSIGSLSFGTGVGNQAQVTIDVVDLVVSFQQTSQTVLEGDELVVTVCNNRITNQPNLVDVNVNFQGIVVTQQDFTTVINNPIQVAIPANALCNSFSLLVANDGDTEEETFNMSIVGSSIGSNSAASATVVIRPIDDNILLRLDPLTVVFPEDDPIGQILLIAERPFDENVIVSIGVEPVTAVQGADFAIISQFVTLPANSLSTPINVLPLEDVLVEVDEILEVYIISATGNSQVMPMFATATVTIRSNDVSQISIVKNDNDRPVQEGGVASFDICSEFNLPASIQITLNLISGTAFINQDFSPGSLGTTIVFPANLGDGMCIPFNVVIIDNTEDDFPLEDFTVSLAAVDPPGVISPVAFSVVCVIADDRPCDAGVSGDYFLLTLTPPFDVDDNHLYFVSNSPFDVGVTVTMGLATLDMFTVPQDGSYVLTLLDSAAFPSNPEDIHSEVIQIQATGFLHVYSQNRRRAGGTGDSTQIYPYRNLGNYYIVTAQPGPYFDSFVSIATREANLVSITFPVAYNFLGITYQPYETAVVPLGAVQAIYLSSSLDLTGTIITSNEPLFVLDGVICNNIPSFFGWCDLTTEQLLPALSVCRLSVVGPVPSREAYTVHFTATEDNTEVSFRSETITLMAGDQARRFVRDDYRVHEISSNNPIYVYQYLASFTVDFQIGDPAKLVLPPVSDFTGAVNFYVPDIGGQAALTIYIRCQERVGLLLDGSPVEGLDYYIAEGKVWCSVTLTEVTAGRRHAVTHVNPNVLFYVAIFNQMKYFQEGSAMSAGFDFGCGDLGCSCSILPSDPCFNQPCLNEGICRRKMGSPNGYFCRCRGNFFGENCGIGSSVCTVSNFRDYVTFDQSELIVDSNCRYTLLSLPNLPGAFTIQIWYDDCPNPANVQLILCFIIGNYIIYFRPGGLVEVNGATAQFPIINLDGIEIRRSNMKLVFISDAGIRVVYDENGDVLVQASNLLNGLPRGLCGNADGLQNEFVDFQQYGLGAEIAFANSFSDQSLTSCILPDPLNPPAVPQCNANLFVEASVRCNALDEATGPFSPCFNTVNRAPFIATCIMNLCSRGLDLACQSFEPYVMACADAGVDLVNWRTATNCELSCPSGLFTDCTNSCPRTCYFLLTGNCECIEGSCFRGCECPAGYYLSNGRCVAASGCGCIWQGLYYDIGESYVDASCGEKCICTARGTFTCEKYACHPNAICTTSFQQQPICRCATGYTGNGEVCVLDTHKGITRIEQCYGQQCDGVCMTSPNYSGSYNNWETILYVVGAPCAANIRVECPDIATESGKDLLHIGPGADVPDPVCVWQYDLPGVLSLSGNTFLNGWDSNDWLTWMYWNTDRTTTDRGWQCCFFVDDPCRDNPCLNAGVCMKQPDFTYTCKCPRGYTGRNCQELVYYCGSYGDPHYYTFDGLYYDFHGACDYLLLTSTTGGIDIQIRQSLGRTTAGSLATGNEVITISVPDFVIELRQGGVTLVNGIATSLPFVPPRNLELSIRRAGQFVVVTIELESFRGVAPVEVWWNGFHFVEIQWPFTHREYVNGLCGIPDGNVANDHQTRAGVPTPDDQAFALTFRDPPTCVDTPAVVDACLGGTDPAFLYANFLCNAAFDTNGAFSVCIAALPNAAAAAFGQSCLFDGCQTLPYQGYICDTLQALEHYCLTSGISVGSWRSPELCADCCPPNSVWNDCGSANPPTCSNPNPLCDRLCTAGCQCLDGFIWDNGECIPADQCGCFDAATGRYYPRGSVFLNDLCNLQTFCLDNGQLFTEGASCTANQGCSNQDGRPACRCLPGFISIGMSLCQDDPCDPSPCNSGECLADVNVNNQVVFAVCRCPRGFTGNFCQQTERVCSVFGDPHHRTFDNQFFDFHGRCSYILAEDGCSAGIQNTFRIAADYSAYGRGLTAAESVTIAYQDDVVTLNRFGFVVVNGIFVFPPAAITGGLIYRTGDTITVRTPDFEVRWSGLFNVDIRVPITRTDICGLCGNNNGNGFDDFRTPTGVTVVSPTDFGNSWLVVGQSCSILAASPPDPCLGLDDETMSRINTICGGIRESTGSCPDVVDPSPYITACIQDGCANPLSNDGPTNTLWAYIEACSSRGVLPENFGPSNLPTSNPAKSCPPNSYFSFSSPECEPSCSDQLFNPPSTSLCPEERTPGCRCSEGYVRNGGACVLPSACGCTDGVRYYPVGQEWIRPGCMEKCQCIRNEQSGLAETVCCLYMCSPQNSLCDVNDGARSCVCAPGFFGNGLSCLPTSCNPNPCQNSGTCRDLPNGQFQCLCRPGTFGETCEQDGALCYIYGDSSFDTFDGRRYDLQGVCEYRLVEQCGNIGGAPFSISGTLENVPNSPLSRLASVRIRLTNPRALEFDLRRDGVYFNNNPTSLVLPYYSAFDSVEIYYSGNDVWFRCPFFNVRWDRESSAIIEMRGLFFNTNLCGLCGNYDNNPANDFVTSIGAQVLSPEALANNFRVTGVCAAAVPAPANPCAANPNNAVLANTYCAIINDPFGPFVNCLQDHRNLALDECQRDVCQTGQGERICPILNALEHRCLVTNGGPPVDWRPLSPFACPTDCPAGATYSHCVPVCGNTCSSSFRISLECNYPCVSGCQCEAGFVLQGDACIPATDCGCYDPNGNYYAVGDFYLIANCGTQCTCTRNGFPNCVAYQCPANAACSTNTEDRSENCICQNGFLGDGMVCTPDPCSTLNCNTGECVVENLRTYCICPQGFTGTSCELALTSCYSYGDPHFRTFDGQFFNYHGPCSYTLASLLTPFAGVAEDFIVIQHNAAVPTQLVTITDSISVAFPTLGGQNYISMNTDGVVTDVTGIVYTLPWQYHSDVMVETNGIVIFIKTTFGVLIEWHYREAVTKVSITETYRSRMQGLCGNFDGILTNDLGLFTANGFGNEFLITEASFPVQLPQFQPPCNVPLNSNAPQISPCTVVTRPDAAARCNIQGNLGECRISEEAIAVSACIDDVCAKQSSPRSQCSAYAFAAHSCEDAGVPVLDWRQNGCQIDCPGLSFYSASASSCPPTCFDLLNMDNSPCTEQPREGCICPAGYFWSGNECVLPENCGCIANGIYFALNEIYYTAGCVRRCQCTSDNAIVCTNVNCNVNAACLTGTNGRPQCTCNAGYEGDGLTCAFGDCPNGCGSGVCGDQNGRPGCICPVGRGGPTCNLVRQGCHFRGDPHYTTFDGRYYDYQGECSYYMLVTRVNGGVTISNTNAPYGVNAAAVTESIRIELRTDRTVVPPLDPLTTIRFLQARRVEIQIGNGPTQLIVPPYVGNGFTITDAAGLVRLQTDTGVEVEWNGIYDGAIYLSNDYMGPGLRTFGLCGTFDGDQSNDWTNQFGFPVNTPDGFGQMSQDRRFNGDCEPFLATNPCDNDQSFLNRAQAICGVINTAGPLAACAVAIADYSRFLANCIYDVCQALPAEDDPKVCGTIQAYVHLCQQTGIVVGDWRAALDPVTLCEPECPSGSVYSSCTSLCPLTCRESILSGDSIPTCTTNCQEGCECLPGLVWQSGICIDPAQCGCFDPLTSQVYAPGSTFLTPTCSQCSCMPGGNLNCNLASCHCAAECMLVGTGYQCVCEPPFVGDGFVCEVNPCFANNPCSGTATCLSATNPITTNLETYCSCPPGSFGNDCGVQSRTCRAVGGELFFGYDGEVTLFYGQCTYILTRTISLNDPNYFEVRITLTDETQITGANQISSITVFAGTEMVTVTRSESPDGFFIDNQQNVIITKGNLEIVAWSLVDRVIVFLNRGVILSFTQTTVEVTTSNAFAGNLIGACGDNDGFRNDGSIAFQGTNCPTAPLVIPCPSLQQTDQNSIQARCSEIINFNGFGACASLNTALLSQCLAAGCVNFPDLSPVCAFVDIANSLCGTNVLLTAFAFCVPTCGNFQTFSTDISACPETCSDTFPLPDCPVPRMSGCQCDAGRILDSDGACVLPAQCGCQQLNVNYEVGEVYYTPACGEICTCALGGFPNCRPFVCPPEATCIMTSSRYTCQCPDGFRLENEQCVVDPCVGSPCANGGTCSVVSNTQFECCCLPGFDGTLCDNVLEVCKIFGNPYIHTFDGQRYHFIGGGDNCEYQLATGSGCIGDNNFNTVQNFDLRASFVRDTLRQPPRTARLGSIRFSAFNLPTIQIIQGGVILLDGVQVFCPVQQPEVLITCVYDNIIVRFIFGLNIVWREDYAYVYLDNDYSLNTCGLCGNMNEDPADDNALRQNNVINPFNIFGDSYEVAGCASPTPPTDGADLCPSQSANTVTDAESLCSLYQETTGPFGLCIQADPATATSFYTACRNNLCEFPLLRGSSCSTYESFAHYCRNAGYMVRDWRSTLNQLAGGIICDFTCPSGSSYTTEMITCPPSCALDSGINSKRDCLPLNLEGCRCDPGLVLENDRCVVQATECGCPYLFAYLPIGRSVLDDTCQQRITCAAAGNLFSEVFTCPLGGACVIDTFQRICRCPGNTLLFQGQCLPNPCSVDPCNGRGRCVIDNLLTNSFYCICQPAFTGATCLQGASQCSVYGDPNFRTFDGEFYEFLAQGCMYYLVNTPSVQIFIETEPVSIGGSLTPLSRVIRLFIMEASVNVEFVLDIQGVQVVVDDRRVITPLDVANGVGTIVNAGSSSYVTYISNTRGYTVRLSPAGAVDIKYPRGGEIRNGLCGDADGQQTLSTFNQVLVNTFGEAARVSPCDTVAQNLPAVVCDPPQDLVCALLLPGLNSLLEPCFPTVNSAEYLADCRKDLCAASNTPTKACAVIATYAQWCRDSGVIVGNWRANTVCAITCPENSFFDTDAPVNPAHCANPNPNVASTPLPRVESCTCSTGYLLEGTTCRLPADCGCTFNGIYYRRGDSFFSNTCDTFCTCPLTGTFDQNIHCQAGIQCDLRATCRVQNNVQSCVCNAGLEGDGRVCFPAGCGNFPCMNGGICQTRLLPNQPDNPDFYCECPQSFIGQECSISTLATTDLFAQPQPPLTLTSRNSPSQYPPNTANFQQVYCGAGTTHMIVTFNSFVTERVQDFLFVGVGFPTLSLESLRLLVADNTVPWPSGVEALSGFQLYGDLRYATDAMWFYFESDGTYELTGFNLGVACSAESVPLGIVGNCFDGERTQPNNQEFLISDCEECFCDNGDIACARNDQQGISQEFVNLGLSPSQTLVRGSPCNSDLQCAGIPGSRCFEPNCLGAGCPNLGQSICSSGDSLRFCSRETLCLQVAAFLSEDLSLSLSFDELCTNLLNSLVGSRPCLRTECVNGFRTGRKRDAEIEIVLRVAARSYVRSYEELEEDMEDLRAILPNATARLLREYDYITRIEIVQDEASPGVVPTKSGINVVDAGILDTETTPWTYLLAALAVVLLLVAVGLAVTIVSYYRKQSNSLNVKFEPAAPSYPRDNLPESLEMVKSEERNDATVFARRIPLDDSTGNHDNVFALSWARDSNDSKSTKKGHSNC